MVSVVCSCACLHVCECICMFLCVYVHVYVHECMSMSMHVCACMHLCVFMHADVCVVWQGGRERVFFKGDKRSPQNNKETEFVTTEGKRPTDKPPHCVHLLILFIKFHS